MRLTSFLRVPWEVRFNLHKTVPPAMQKKLFTGGNKAVFSGQCLRIPLISFVNMLIATFLQNFLETHNGW
jgi:hypothetical protein